MANARIVPVHLSCLLANDSFAFVHTVQPRTQIYANKLVMHCTVPALVYRKVTMPSTIDHCCGDSGKGVVLDRRPQQRPDSCILLPKRTCRAYIFDQSTVGNETQNPVEAATISTLIVVSGEPRPILCQLTIGAISMRMLKRADRCNAAIHMKAAAGGDSCAQM